MLAENIIAEVTKANQNVEQIKTRFFEVIKVPMTPFVNNVAMAVAHIEATQLTAEVMEENKTAIKENPEVKPLEEDKIFNFMYKKAYKKALSKYVDNQAQTTKLSAPKDMYGIYNAKTGALLSQKSLGKDFTPMQQIEFLNNIISTIVDFGADLDISTLDFRIFGGGSRIEFTVKMHPISFKNNKKVKDVTNMFLTFSTSYDGSKSSRISLYTERLVCTNGMTARKLEGELKGRNTQGGKNKILSYAKEVAEIINGGKEFAEKMQQLDKIKVTKTDIENFTLSLFGFNRESLKAEAKKAIAEGKEEPKNGRKFTILDNFDLAMEIEMERTGVTAFGLLQSATYYTNHLANTSKTISNHEYIRFFQGAKTNDKAQELIFAML